VTVILSILQIDLESSISARFGVGATAVAVGALFALIAGQFELGLCLLSLLGGAGGYVIYKSRQMYQMVFNSYYEVLDLAIEEVLKWTTTVTGSYTAKMSKEKKLQMLGGLHQSHNNLEQDFAQSSWLGNLCSMGMYNYFKLAV
jgi:hypothetical protein